MYDGNTLVGFNYKAGATNADYYYGIDNFGNINYIYDANGNIVTTYKYDAWGKAIATTGSLASTIGAINPYRYKSYYYDQEIQMYYLQSRYYDVIVDRFISPDMSEFMGTSGGVYSYNLYAYCENEPVNNSDHRGTFLRSFYRSAQLVKSVVNFFKNGKNDYECTGKLIMGQDYLPDVYYGIAKMPDVGCEIITTYNAMVLLGQKPSLRSIILEFENNGSQWLWGTMGSNPRLIRRYLFWHSPVPTYACYSVEDIEEVVKIGDVIILSAWNYKNNILGGLHTVAIYYTGSNYLVYNEYSSDIKSRSYKSLNELFVDGKFIIAYYMRSRGFWI